MAFDLTLNCPSSSLAESLQLPGSLASALLKSKAYGRWERGRDANGKLATAVLQRIDGVTTALGNLSKGLFKR